MIEMSFFESYLDDVSKLQYKIINNQDDTMLLLIDRFRKKLIENEEFYDKLNEFYEFIREKPRLFGKFVFLALSNREQFAPDWKIEEKYYIERNKFFRETFIDEPNQDTFDNFSKMLSEELIELRKTNQTNLEKMRPNLNDHKEKNIDPMDMLTNGGSKHSDPLFLKACQLVTKLGIVSSSIIQKSFCIGYGRSCGLLTDLQDSGIISNESGIFNRWKVIITEKDIKKYISQKQYGAILSGESNIEQELQNYQRSEIIHHEEEAKKKDEEAKKKNERILKDFILIFIGLSALIVFFWLFAELFS